MDDLFTIDQNRLDGHFLEHPNRMWKYTTAEAEARDDHARAKAAQDLVEAEMQLAVRSNPVAFGLKEKPNNDEVAATVRTQKMVVKAIDATLEAKRKLDYQAARVAVQIEFRRAAERMVDLLTINYVTAETPGGRAAAENAGRQTRTETPAPKRRKRDE